MRVQARRDAWSRVGGTAVSILVWLIALVAPATAADRVLILIAEAPGSAGGPLMQAAIDEALYANGAPAEVFRESLDTTWFGEPDREAAVAGMLAAKYERTPPSLTIALGETAAEFVRQQRSRLFPLAPVLLGAMDERAVRGRDLGPTTFAVSTEVDAAATLRLARSLFPNLREVLVVGGASAFDRSWFDLVRNDIATLGLPLTVRYVANVPIKTALGEIASLGPDAAVLFVSMTVDADGTSRSQPEVATMVRRATGVPIFGLSSGLLGNGIIGGYFIDLERHGRDLGTFAANLLRGPARPNAASTVTPSVPTFDARELGRFGIADTALPPGAVVRFRPPGFLATYRLALLAAAAAVALVMLAVGVAVQMRGRRRSEALLAAQRSIAALVDELLGTFATVPPERIDLAVASGLRRAAETTGAETVILWRPDSGEDLSWVPPRLHAGESVTLRGDSEYPASLRAHLRRRDPAGASVVASPVRGHEGLLGVLLWIAREPLPPHVAQQLPVISEAFVHALRRRSFDLAVERSERLKRAVLASLTTGIVVLDTSGVVIEVNEAWKRFGRANGAGELASSDTGVSFRHLCERHAFAGLPASGDILDGVEAVCAGGSLELGREYHVSGPTGERWFALRVVPLLTGEGGAVISHLEITEQKRAERVLHTLSARLISAQEEERLRIARDLHDDIGQRVALLGMEIEQTAIDSEPPVRGRIQSLGDRVAEVATEIHRLSHALHSAKLDALGLVAAVRGHCREMRAAGLVVEFSDDTVLADVPRDVGLCLFRVVQESLNNVLKHSGVDRAEVRLIQQDHTLTARIVDAGRGFSVIDATEQGGIGLVGMRERLAASGGTLTVHSSPGAGTTVEASVPLPRIRPGDA